MSLDFGYVSYSGTKPQLKMLANSKMLAVDAETTGLNMATDNLVCYSITESEDHAYMVSQDNRFFANMLADETKCKLGHNMKFDRAMFKKKGITFNNVCDTMVAAHLLEYPSLSLDYLLKTKYFDTMKHRTYLEYPYPLEYSTPQQLAEHFSSHAAGLQLLWKGVIREDGVSDGLLRNLNANSLTGVFSDVEMPLVPVLSDMELQGAYINTDTLNTLGEKLKSNADTLETALHHYAGAEPGTVNFNSPEQVSRIMYKEVGVPLPPEWTFAGKTRPGCDKVHLAKYADKYTIVNLYLKYKHFKHLYNTYVVGILDKLVDNRIHTTFNQTVTRTGRLSSSKPNLQNIPIRSELGKRIREAFCTPPDSDSVIVKVDFDQMELRDIACWADCTPMINAFNSGEDVHATTAIRVFGDIKYRPEAKTLHYQLIYGGGEKEHVEMFFKAYPEIKQWIDKRQWEFRNTGYAKTRFGRKRTLGNYRRMSGMERAHANREGISTIVQGSCAEIMKIGMRKVWEEVRDSDIKMILQVHDELVFECPKKRIRDLYDIIQRNLVYRELQIPLTTGFKVGKTWASGIEIDRSMLKDLDNIVAEIAA